MLHAVTRLRECAIACKSIKLTHVLALDVLQEREEKVLVEEGRDLLDVVELSHLGCLINNCYQRVAPQLPCPLSQI